MACEVSDRTEVAVVICELVAATVPERVGVHPPREVRSAPNAGKEGAEAVRGHGCVALGGEHIGGRGVLLALEYPQGSQFRSPQGVGARLAALDAADMEVCGLKLDLLPAEPHELGGTQHVAVRREYHGGVAVSVAAAALAGSLDNEGNLPRREVLARSALLALGEDGRDWPVYNWWHGEVGGC